MKQLNKTYGKNSEGGRGRIANNNDKNEINFDVNQEGMETKN